MMAMWAPRGKLRRIQIKADVNVEQTNKSTDDHHAHEYVKEGSLHILTSCGLKRTLNQRNRSREQED